MKDWKNIAVLPGLVLAVSLIAVSTTALMMTGFYQRTQFHTLEAVCQGMIKDQPDMAQTVSAVLKEYKNHPEPVSSAGLLAALGFRPSDFLSSAQINSMISAAAGFAFGCALFFFTFWYLRRRETLRIRTLADYLEKVNTGKPALLSIAGEDEFSKLQDEIYKTVTMLYQTRDSALEARNNYAENLSNIAHQLGTPISAISLISQMMKVHSSGEYPDQIEKQLSRLTHLEEALLLLSRIDAGTLVLDKSEIDVFTVLMLAADNLQELSCRYGVSIAIPESGSMAVTADLEWTMEAMMNLIKNCIEYTPAGGTVHCSYGTNPLYTEILIRDEGPGFEKEDLSHLFERFYRGRNAGKNGIGIGLSLAKEIIERQNGTIRAKNLPNGGACFEIRFYCH